MKKGERAREEVAELRARRSERQLATAQQITHIGSWEWNLGTNVVTWSDELYRIYGLTPRSCEITFEGFLSRLHDEDRERIARLVSEAVKNQKPFHYRERIVRPDGSCRELDSMGEPSFDDRGRFMGLIGTCRDVTEERARVKLEAGGHRVLEMIATAAPLQETLSTLARVIEGEDDGMKASILLFDPQHDVLRVGAAPSLPEEYNRQLENLAVGPGVGSCGTAAFLRAPVYVTDITSDPLWKDYRHVANYGLRACWSTPIFANDGRVLGTFAIYYTEARAPSDEHIALIQRATYIAGIAIERRQMEEQLLALSAHVERAREEERTGIARELHDELGQSLTGLKMDICWIERRIAALGASLPDEVRGRMSDATKLIDDTIAEVRRISSELRPGVLDHLGLVAAIEWQAHEFEKRTGTPCAVETNPKDATLPRDASTAVFRIFQEALTNVTRHAAAKHVNVKFEKRGEKLVLEVADDGKGIREEAARSPTSLGLLGIRERARRMGGEVVVARRSTGGTTVRLSVPFGRRSGSGAP